MDVPGLPATSLAANKDFVTQRARMPKDVAVLSYVDVKGDMVQSYDGLKLLLRMLPLMAGPGFADLAGLAEKMPDVDVITPHLFGSVGTFRFDGEGFMLESYGPLGGATNPVGAGTVAMGGVMAGFLVPALMKAKETAHRATCMNNLRQISVAMKQFAVDNDDRNPRTFGELLKGGYLTTTKVFFCPSTRSRLPDDFPADFKEADLAALNRIDALTDYVMVKDMDAASTPDFIMAHDKPGNHRGAGRNCLHVDGHVRWYPEAEFQRKMDEQRKKMAEMNE
jgi:prepilin-type processing-associated H-X9-DG protein